jgi:hypothetical protein
VEIWVRSSFSGVSSGTSTAGDEILDAGDARELGICADNFWETVADVREDLVPDTRPGIFDGLLNVMGGCLSKLANRSEVHHGLNA